MKLVVKKTEPLEDGSLDVTLNLSGLGSRFPTFSVVLTAALADGKLDFMEMLQLYLILK